MIFLIDQDGPLANFEKSFLIKWRAKFFNEPFVPLKQRTTFYARDQYPEHLHSKMESIYLAPGFILGLPPTTGAIAAVKKMIQLGHDVRICTSPLSQYDNCILEKFQWVEKYFGREFTKKIISAKDKTLICGDLLIDDKPEIGGIMEPGWEHVIFDCPHNRDVTNKKRINWKNWRKILNV